MTNQQSPVLVTPEDVARIAAGLSSDESALLGTLQADWGMPLLYRSADIMMSDATARKTIKSLRDQGLAGLLPAYDEDRGTLTGRFYFPTTLGLAIRTHLKEQSNVEG